MNDNYISERTLKMMDKAMENLKEGKSGEPIDLDKMRELADSLEDA